MFAGGVQLDWPFDPIEALRRWPIERRVSLLHSGRFDPRWARRSILAEPIESFRFRIIDGQPQSQWLVTGDGAGVHSAQSLSHKPFTDLRHFLATCDGPLIGYLSYDLGRFIERLPTRAIDDRGWPIIELAHCPGYLMWDAQHRRWSAHGTWARGGFPALDRVAPQPSSAIRATNLRSGFDRAGYERAVGRTMEYIAAGDVFQVNLSQRLTAELSGPFPAASRSLFQRLNEVSPAWYGAYLELAQDNACSAPRRALVSTSPELFLELDSNGRVVTRPIKGTRPAHVEADRLRESLKDAAELNMIVDLMRNDLGRVCTYGSVAVPQARVIESHPTVHHGVATITGRLHESRDVVDLLRATMPGGSVTGAPKVRAMEIIDELEPTRRGPYCGAIGWLTKREACLSITIRTLMVEFGGSATTPHGNSGEVDFAVGGGVVADSSPAAEYDETLDKAAAMLTALGLKRDDLKDVSHI